MADLNAFKDGIEVPITGDNSGLKAAVKESQDEVNSLGTSIQAHSKTIKTVGIAATAAGGAIVGAFSLATMASVDFESSMSEVYTLLPDLSADARDQMSEDLREFDTEMGVTSEKSIPALYQAISAGVPKDNVFDFLTTANKAAVGGVTDLETAVDGISSVVNAYGSDVIDATKAGDQMFTAVKLGKTNFEQLSGSLYNVIPTAASLGLEFGNVTAALSTMTSQGTPTKVATTQLRQALVELSKDGSKASEAFKEVAGVGFKDFIAEGNNLQDALGVISEAADNNNVAINDMFGSVEAGAGVLSLTGGASEKFASDLEAMGTSAGSLDTAFETMDETSGRSMDKIMAMMETFKLEIGDVFLPILKDDILPALSSLLKMFDGIPDSAKPLILAIGALGGALVIVGPLLIALPGLITAVGVAFTLLSANPIILVVGGLILLLIWLQSEFDILGIAIDVIGGLFTWISDIIGGFIGWITNAIDWVGLFSDVFEVFQTVVGFVAGAIIGYFTNMWDTIKMIINFVIDGVNTMIGAINSLSFDVPDWVTDLTGFTDFGFNLSTIPRLAEGGIVSEPTIAMIGEAGPEAVVPLSGGSIGSSENALRKDGDIIFKDCTFTGNEKHIAQALHTLITNENRARGIR